MKIALVGRVAEDKELFDGQTIKTRLLYDLLKEIDQVYLVDTYEYRKHIFSILIKSIKALVTCDVLVMSISINGRKVFFPFFYYLNKIFKKNIYHALIGGRLANNINENPNWKKYVNSFKINWVESHELISDLKRIGVSNAVYLPNFKRLNPVQLKENHEYQYIYKYCMFSRIQKKKGISDAIEAINGINKKYQCIKAKLDIYGPIDKTYETEFFQMLNKYKDFIEYKGVVDSSESVDTIKDYFMLLFPTRYYNEGIPGTIIDAMAAGVPVIARKWHFCSEILEHKQNSYIYEFDKPDDLFQMIDYSINNSLEVEGMKANCIVKSREYMFESAFEIINYELTKIMETYK
ncbi:glycosyltransferase [Enterococcus sp. DIV2446a]|uniref:glycosyltransferase n=1 Tax=Enterococcus sp. DIV2446a TaxID=2774810 RepID=UPI003F22194F